MISDLFYLGLGAEAFALTLNRAAEAADRFTLPTDGWFQIGAVGEMDKELSLPGGKKVTIRQVVTPGDLATIENRFKEWAAKPGFGGLLVDYDHFSSDTSKPTRAAAWIMAAETRNRDELWGQLRLSTSGRAALEGGDYRHFSPVLGFPPREYRPGEAVHPVALLGGALTNQPTFRGMQPLSANRDNPLSPATMNKDKVIQLLAALGQTIAADAAPEAFDAALDAAIAKAKGNSTDLAATKNRLAVLEGEQITRDLDAYKLQGPAREQWKGALTNNRESGLALLKATLGEPGQGGHDYARTHNRDAARTPAQATAEANEAAEAAKIRSRTADLQARGVDFRNAHAQATREIRGS
jgi:hypothetical protein